MRTEEKRRNVESAINPLSAFTYYAIAFVVMWAIIIAAIFTAGWVIHWMTK